VIDAMGTLTCTVTTRAEDDEMSDIEDRAEQAKGRQAAVGV
jgi:hypothetical protein